MDPVLTAQLRVSLLKVDGALQALGGAGGEVAYLAGHKGEDLGIMTSSGRGPAAPAPRARSPRGKESRRHAVNKGHGGKTEVEEVKDPADKAQRTGKESDPGSSSEKKRAREVLGSAWETRGSPRRRVRESPDAAPSSLVVPVKSGVATALGPAVGATGPAGDVDVAAVVAVGFVLDALSKDQKSQAELERDYDQQVVRRCHSGSHPGEGQAGIAQDPSQLPVHLVCGVLRGVGLVGKGMTVPVEEGLVPPPPPPCSATGFVTQVVEAAREARPDIFAPTVRPPGSSTATVHPLAHTTTRAALQGYTAGQAPTSKLLLPGGVAAAATSTTSCSPDPKGAATLSSLASRGSELPPPQSLVGATISGRRVYPASSMPTTSSMLATTAATMPGVPSSPLPTMTTTVASLPSTSMLRTAELAPLQQRLVQALTGALAGRTPPPVSPGDVRNSLLSLARALLATAQTRESIEYLLVQLHRLAPLSPASSLGVIPHAATPQHVSTTSTVETRLTSLNHNHPANGPTSVLPAPSAPHAPPSSGEVPSANAPALAQPAPQHLTGAPAASPRSQRPQTSEAQPKPTPPSAPPPRRPTQPPPIQTSALPLSTVHPALVSWIVSLTAVGVDRWVIEAVLRAFSPSTSATPTGITARSPGGLCQPSPAASSATIRGGVFVSPSPSSLAAAPAVVTAMPAPAGMQLGQMPPCAVPLTVAAHRASPCQPGGLPSPGLPSPGLSGFSSPASGASGFFSSTNSATAHSLSALSGSIPIEVKTLAEAGQFDKIRELWGEAVMNAAFTWVWNISQTLPLSSAVFQLAKEGRFYELEEEHSLAVVDTMYGWVYLKSEEWSATRDARARSLIDKQKKTVEHVLTTVLDVDPAKVADMLPEGMHIVQDQDSALAEPTNPFHARASLQAEADSSNKKEEALLSHLSAYCGASPLSPRRKTPSVGAGNGSVGATGLVAGGGGGGASDKPCKTEKSGREKRPRSTPSHSTAAELMKRARGLKRYKRAQAEQDCRPRQNSAMAMCHAIPPLACTEDPKSSSSGGDVRIMTQSIAWQDIAQQFRRSVASAADLEGGSPKAKSPRETITNRQALIQLSRSWSTEVLAPAFRELSETEMLALVREAPACEDQDIRDVAFRSRHQVVLDKMKRRIDQLKAEYYEANGGMGRSPRQSRVRVGSGRGTPRSSSASQRPQSAGAHSKPIPAPTLSPTSGK